MKNKKFLDFPKLIKRVWVILWLILIILLIMKFCFGIWYPIVVENEHLVKAFNWVDNHKIVFNILNYCLYVLNSYFVLLTFIKKLKFTKPLIMVIYMAVMLGVAILKQQINIIGIISEIVVIIIAIVYNLKYKTYYKTIFNIIIPIIIYIIINLWQFNIYLVRDLDLNKLTDYNSAIIFTMQIDYYIFLIILWLGVKYMGFAGWGWLWNKDITELKALREKELSKSKPNQKLLSEIDRVIKSKEEMGE